MRKLKKVLVYSLIITMLLSDFSQGGLIVRAKENDTAIILNAENAVGVTEDSTAEKENDSADSGETTEETNAAKDSSAGTGDGAADDVPDHNGTGNADGAPDHDSANDDTAGNTGGAPDDGTAGSGNGAADDDTAGSGNGATDDDTAGSGNGAADDGTAGNTGGAEDSSVAGSENDAADPDVAEDGNGTVDNDAEEPEEIDAAINEDVADTRTRYQCFQDGSIVGDSSGYPSEDDLKNSGIEYDGYVKIETDGTAVTVTPYAAEGYEFMTLNLTGTDGTVSTPLTKDYRKKVDTDSNVTAERITDDASLNYSFTVDSNETAGTGAALGTVYPEMPAISAYFDRKEGLLNGQLLSGTMLAEGDAQVTQGDIKSWLGPIDGKPLYGTLHVGINGTKTDAWNGVDCGNGDYITYYAGEGNSFVIDAVCAYSRLGWSDNRFVAEIQGSYDGTSYTQIAYIRDQTTAKKNSIVRASVSTAAEYPYIRLYARAKPANISLLKLYGSIKTTQVAKEYLFFKDGEKVATQTELDVNSVGAAYDGYVETAVTDGEAVTVTAHAADGYAFMMLNLTDQDGSSTVATPLTKDYRRKVDASNKVTAERITGNDSTAPDYSYSFTIGASTTAGTGTDNKALLGTAYQKMPAISAFFDPEEDLLNGQILSGNMQAEDGTHIADTSKDGVNRWLGSADSSLKYGTLHVGDSSKATADTWDGKDSKKGDYITYYAGAGKAFQITGVRAYSRLGWPERLDAEVQGSYDNSNYEKITAATKGSSDRNDPGRYSITRQANQTDATYPYIRLYSPSDNADISLLKLYGKVVNAQDLTPVEKYLFFEGGTVIEESESLASAPSAYEGYVKVSTVAGKSVTVTAKANTGYDFMMLCLTDKEGNVTTPLTKDWIRDSKGGCVKNENGKNTCGFTVGADETLTGTADIGSQYQDMPAIAAYFSKSGRTPLNNTLLEMEPYDQKISDETKPITSWIAEEATLNVNRDTSPSSWTGKDVKGGDYITYTAGKGNAFHLEELAIYSRWGFSHDRFGAVLEASNDGIKFVPILTAKNTSLKEKHSVQRINRTMPDGQPLKVRMIRLRAVTNPTDVCLLNIYGDIKATPASELSELKTEDDPVEYPEIKDPVTWQAKTSEAGFAHPCIGITKDELENVRTQIKNKKDPWYSYYTKMLSTKYASREFTCNNAVNGEIKSDAWSVQTMELTVGEDAQRAYTQTLLYVITGDEVYRSNAMKIIRIYEQMDPSKYAYYVDAHIHAPTPVYKMIQAAELLRYTACTKQDLNWTDEDTEKFTTNFVDPACSTLLDYNDKFMNQHNFPLLGTISAAIFKDDPEEYREKVEWLTVNKDAPDPYFTGSIKWLFRWTDDTEGTGRHVQLVEMGRDLAHAGDDVNNLSLLTRILWLQGTKVDPETGTVSTAGSAVNIYAYLDHAVMRGADYFCKYNIGYDIDWNPVRTDQNGSKYTKSSDEYRGRLYSVGLADLYYMYRYELGYTEEELETLAPYFVKAFRERSGPTYYATSSGERTDLDISGAEESWLHIPANVSDADGRVPQSCPADQKYIFEMDRQYSIIDGSNRILTSTDQISTRSDGGTDYIHTLASEGDTRFAVYNVSLINRKGEAKVALRVRTNGRAIVEIKSEDGAQPFQTLVLPDTNREWTNIVFDMGYGSVTAGQYPTDTHLMYFNVVGAGTEVDFDHINVNANGTLNTPGFNENTDSVVRLVGYVGSSISWDFSATGGNPFEDLSYTMQCVQGENEDTQNAQLDENGQFTWTPQKAGTYKWYVIASDQTTLGLVQLEITVAADRKSAVESVREGIDWTKEYLSVSVLDFELAEQNALACIDKTEEEFKTAMEALLKAANSMEELNPQLSDGTLDFPKMVKATSLESGKIANLTDGNSVSHTGDLFAKYFTLDFGAFYRIKATEFKLQARNIWPDRTEGCVVMGSADGQNWDTLTGEAPGCDELTAMPVKAEYQNKAYRYFKVSTAGADTSNHMASTQKIFSLGELRIAGSREEIGTQLRKVSVSTDAAAITNHIGDSKYVQSYPKRATAGNKITLTIEAMHEISDMEVTIAGLDASVTQDAVNPLKYTAEATLTDAAAKVGAGRNAEFCITYHYEGKPAQDVRMTTDGTSVFVTDDEGEISLANRRYDSSKNSTGIENDSQEYLANQIKNLYDGNSKTISDVRQADGAGSGSYLIVDFGEGTGVSLSRVEILGRLDMLSRVMGIYVQGSNDYDFEEKTGTWVTLTKDSLYCEDWQGVPATNNRYFRYLRFINSGNWFGNMSELRVYGDETTDPTKIVDVSALHKLIEEAEKKDLDDYQEDGKAEFSAALDAAKSAMTDATLTQEQVDTVCAQLQTAMDNLKVKEPEVNKPDKTALNALIDEAENINPDDYQEEGKAEFVAALDAARSAMTDDTLTQEQIDTICAQLQTAMDNLKRKEPEVSKPDKTALNTLIKEAEKINLDDYQEGGKAEFSAALDAAKNATADDTLTQEQIDAICAQLKSAMENLKPKEGGITTYYKVVFHSMGGTEIAELTVAAGEPFTAPVPSREGYVFRGWFTDRLYTQAYDFTKAVTGDLILYAAWNTTINEEGAGIHAEEVLPQIYTGKAVRPQVNVYDGDRLLKLNQDYSVRYKNNVNASAVWTEGETVDRSGFDSAKQPAVIITGKGDYSESYELKFDICAKDLTNEDIDISYVDAYTAISKGRQKISLTVKDGNKRLKSNKDYTVTYYDADQTVVRSEEDLKKAGSYVMAVRGKAGSNYCGLAELGFVVVSDDKMPMSKAKVTIASKARKQAYRNGDPVTLPAGAITVKAGKKTLTENEDYTVSYLNNLKPGKAVLMITAVSGEGKQYAGSKKAEFQITGTPLGKVSMSGFCSRYDYTGGEIRQENVTFTDKKGAAPKLLTEGTDYTVRYLNHINAGKATVIYTGINGYTGTVRKSYTIRPIELSGNSDIIAYEQSAPIVAAYTLKGAEPEITVRWKDRMLVNGTDFTLSYQNNKKTADAGASNAPSISVRGKGNFKGLLKNAAKFSIVKQDMSVSAADGSLKAVCTDMPYLAGKADSYRYQTKIAVYDNGKKLPAGNYTAAYTDNTQADLKESLAKGNTVDIPVTITAKENSANYTGSFTTSFRVTPKSLKGCKYTIQPQTYTGKEIRLTDGALQIRDADGSELTEGVDYTIYEYKNNVKSGSKAKVTIKGTGKYSGTLTLKFKIERRRLSGHSAK